MALLSRIRLRLEAAGLWRDTLRADEATWIAAVLDLLKPRVKNLDQLVDELRPFLVDRPDIDNAAAAKHLSDPAMRSLLVLFAERLSTVEPFDPGTIEHVLRSIADTAGVKAAALIHATRVGVTGRAVSAGIFDLLSLLGRSRVVERMRTAATYTPRE
jgi:glutamyl-tRNA synthetase